MNDIELELAKGKRDQAIRNLWVAFRELSDVADEIEERDSDLWELVTLHPAVQDRLTAVFNKENTNG